MKLTKKRREYLAKYAPIMDAEELSQDLSHEFGITLFQADLLIGKFYESRR